MLLIKTLDGFKEWGYTGGKAAICTHRDVGPARVFSNGIKLWYKENKIEYIINDR